MNKKTLEARCIRLYGRATGKKLYRAMVKIAEKDFCVATPWSQLEISIARACASRGRVFEFSEDYSALIMPDGRKLNMENINYADINRFLPREKISFGEGYRHCVVDLMEH
ncbi:hypothetical protein HYV50_05330 [Candidatus Pacearchaeota archaeon]|nr:hypothetical protein [Candidatus Pacearchaeota archaeon]